MSHPNANHEHGNEYPEDKVTHYPKAKKKALHKMKAKVGTKEDAHLHMVKHAGRGAKYHKKEDCPTCSKYE